MKIRERVLMTALMVALGAASAQGQGAVARPTTGGGAGGGGTGGAVTGRGATAGPVGGAGGSMAPATARGGGGGGAGGNGARAGAVPGGGTFGTTAERGASTSYTCEVGEQLANLGIGTFHCQGGDCHVAGIFATTSLPESIKGEAATALYGRGAANGASSPASSPQFSAGTPENRDPKDWSFTVEPSLWGIHANGPAAGKVKEGDVLVAVNGVPVTTPNAAFVLGNMVAGRPINLTLRRGDAIVPAQVFPTGGCLTFGVSTGTGDLPKTLMRDERGRVVNRADGTVIVP